MLLESLVEQFYLPTVLVEVGNLQCSQFHRICQKHELTTLLLIEELLRKFVETYKPFKDISMNLSDLYVKKESMPGFVKTTLRELLYHDLRKIKPIYRDALGIDLGDVSDLYKAVLVRHDLVHRNVKNHEGVEHTITEEMVRELQTKVKALMESVNNQIAERLFDGEEVPDFEDVDI